MKKHKSDPKSWGDATKLVRGGLDRSPHGETSEALFLNSGFVYDEPETAERRFAGEDDGYVYGRYGNPTVTMFEERLALLEGAEACYAAGLRHGRGVRRAGLPAQGGRPSRRLQGAVRLLLPDRDVHPAALRHHARRWSTARTSTPGRRPSRRTPNACSSKRRRTPTLEVIDLEAVCGIAKAKGANVVVDNIFATPILQRPLTYGADVIVYSGTKHMDGQGRVLGGAIVSTKKFKEELLKPFLRHTGPSISPFNAWVLLEGPRDPEAARGGAEPRGAQRWPRRCRASTASARVLYPHLDSHPQAALCAQADDARRHHGDLRGGGRQGQGLRRAAALGIIDISNNLGDAKSLMTHPASTTHRNIGAEARASMGITDGMLRLSVGLEDTDDLIGDLRQALAA